MPELLPTTKPAPAPALTRRPAEGPARRPAGGPDGLDAQLRALAPGPQPRDSGAGALAGEARFRCADPRLDGQPAAVVAAELQSLIERNLEWVEHMTNGAHAALEIIRIREERGVLQDVVDALTEGQAPSVGPWIAVLGQLRGAGALLTAAREASDAPTALARKASMAAQALRAFEAALAAFDATHAAMSDFISDTLGTAKTLIAGAEIVRDASIAVLIAAGSAYFAPTALVGGGTASTAPASVGGTLRAIGGLALGGATVRGVVTTAGTALGGGDLQEVSDAAGRGMRDGAIEGPTSAMGGAVAGGLWGPLKPAAARAPLPLALAARASAEGTGSVVGGAANALTQSVVAGSSASERDRKAADAARTSALQGVLQGALKGRH